MTNTTNLGNIGQAYVIAKFVELGIPVYTPIGEGYPTDLIADFKGKLNKNPFIWIAFFFCLSLQASVILIPKAAMLFGAETLSVTQWLISLSLSSVPLVICEIYKRFK